MKVRLIALVVLSAIISTLAPALPLQAQVGLPPPGSTWGYARGVVFTLQGTPHLWISGEQGRLHWAGDTRALAGRYVDWNNQVEFTLDDFQYLASIGFIGDPWLSAGLLKDGDPIYLVKWESDWAQPQLLHIQSIADVELFGVNGNNYGAFVPRSRHVGATLRHFCRRSPAIHVT